MAQIKVLAFGMLLVSVTSLAADVGDAYRLLLDCQKSDGAVSDEIPIAYDVYAPGRSNSNTHQMFVVEKFGAKHKRMKLATLADSRQVTDREGKAVVEIAPLAGETKLVFAADAIKDGKSFSATLQRLKAGEVVTTYDCSIE